MKIYIKSRPGKIYIAVEEALMMLRNMGYDEESIKVEYLSGVLKGFQDEVKYHSLILEISVAISIFISSMGILGIMMLGASERGKEIGIRQVPGAAKLNAVGQVLNEALILSLFGGFLGVITALLTGKKLIDMLDYTSIFPNVVNINNISLKGTLVALCSIILLNQIIAFLSAMLAKNVSPLEATRN